MCTFARSNVLLPKLKIMAYTETTTRGYGSRVKNSCSGVGMGFILFCVATAMLWWNEGRAVKTTKMLNEAQEVTVEMDNPGKIDPELNGQMVHATSMTATKDLLRDSIFQLSTNAVYIGHRVEYYQWREYAQQTTKDKMGGSEEITTTYTYSKEWVPAPVNSSAFKDPKYQNTNKVLFTFDDFSNYATNVSFGAYQLSEGQIARVGTMEPWYVEFDPAVLDKYEIECKRILGKLDTKTVNTLPETAPEDIKESSDPTLTNDMTVVLSPTVEDSAAAAQKVAALAQAKEAADSLALAQAEQGTAVTQSNPETQTPTAPAEKKTYDYAHVEGNVFYLGFSQVNPQIGDVRVTFYKAMPCTVSILAKVKDNTFTNYKAKNGKSFSSLVNGEATADEMYEGEHQQNKILLWALRIIGTLLVIAALRAIFDILVTILKVVPFLSKIGKMGMNFVTAIVGVIWALIVIAIAWLFYRPVISVCAIAVAAVLLFFLMRKGKKMEKTQPATVEVEG